MVHQKWRELTKGSKNNANQRPNTDGGGRRYACVFEAKRPVQKPNTLKKEAAAKGLSLCTRYSINISNNKIKEANRVLQNLPQTLKETDGMRLAVSIRNDLQQKHTEENSSFEGSQ